MSTLGIITITGLSIMGLICIAAIITEIAEMINNFKK
jgi:hypothetical protein